MASGPSAGEANLELARSWPTMVVNDAWRLAPWAAALYACDGAWWDVHHVEVARSFRGELWTQDEKAARRFGLQRVRGKHRNGLSAEPGLIYFNANGGAQGMNLGYHFGGRRFVLVGYDMGPDGKREHFFGAHPASLRNKSPYANFIRAFDVIAADCKRLGLEVVNTSAASRLRCFPRATLAEALG